MAARIFVVWDFSIERLKLTLQSLVKRPPAGFQVGLAGDAARAGSILLDVVIRGISDADRVLVITDRPNANVGFEAGLAIGLGKPVLFAHHGDRLPDWSLGGPLTDILQGSFEHVDALRSLIVDDRAWITAERAPSPFRDGLCLDLCPRRGEGGALREEREDRIADGWVRPPRTPITLSELNRRFDGTNRLVWTIANYPENADVRDGEENAANAILAGWFYARCRGYLDRNRRDEMPFWVLRSGSSRRVVDVALHEYEGRPFSDLDDYGRRLLAIDRTWRARHAEATRQRKARPGIAVLRFRNTGTREEDEAFSDGLTEMLIDRLTDLSSLRTVPRTSVLDLEAKSLAVDEIARRLNVDYLLEGSLDRSLDPLCRIAVRLIQTSDLSYAWSESRTVEWANIQQVRSEIVEAVSRRLHEMGGLLEVESEPEEPPRPIEAVDHFMLGRYRLRSFNNHRRDEDRDASERHFRRALQLDPGYVDARSQLGFLSILAWETDGGTDWLEISEAIWQTIMKERPDDAFAVAEHAYVTWVLRGDALKAIERARRSVAEAPESSIAPNVLALLYLYLGFWESNVHIELNDVIPRDPAYLYPRANAALAFQLMGNAERARELSLDILAIDRDAFVAKLMLGTQDYIDGRLDDAGRTWRAGLRRSQPAVAPVFETVLGWLQARSGDADGARATIRRLNDARELRGPYAPYYIALCALAGEHDLAVERLRTERTFASSYRYLVTEPALRSLANHAGFRALLETRYDDWRRNLDELGGGLPEPPPAVPTPTEFLT